IRAGARACVRWWSSSFAAGVATGPDSPSVRHSSSQSPLRTWRLPAIVPSGRPSKRSRTVNPDDVEKVAATLAAAERGDQGVAADLFPVLYRELHRLARSQLQRNPGALTLGATTLLHEA